MHSLEAIIAMNNSAGPDRPEGFRKKDLAPQSTDPEPVQDVETAEDPGGPPCPSCPLLLEGAGWLLRVLDTVLQLHWEDCSWNRSTASEPTAAETQEAPEDSPVSPHLAAAKAAYDTLRSDVHENVSAPEVEMGRLYQAFVAIGKEYLTRNRDRATVETLLRMLLDSPEDLSTPTANTGKDQNHEEVAQ